MIFKLNGGFVKRKRVIFAQMVYLRRENASFSLKWGFSEWKMCDFHLDVGFLKRKLVVFCVNWGICKEKMRDFRLNFGFSERKREIFA